MEPSPYHREMLDRALERVRPKLARDPSLATRWPVAGEELSAHCPTSIACLARSCEMHAERPCLAERAFELVGGSVRYRPEYRAIRYADLWARVCHLASGLAASGFAAKGDRVGLSGFSGIDWVVADLACLYLGAVSVPLPISASAAELSQIISDAGVTCVVSSLERLSAVAEVLSRAPAVHSIIVMGLIAEDRAQAEALELRADAVREEHGERVTVVAMADLERLGRERGSIPYCDPRARDATTPSGPEAPDPLVTIMYTSGSTGTPKGAMFPESLWVRWWRRASLRPDVGLPQVVLNYLPLNHLAGRGEVMQSIASGDLVCFALASDMSTLFEDIRIARPTHLMLVPRVASMIHGHYQTELVKRSAGARDEAERARIGREIVEEMRGSFLGDRLLFVTTGTAPTAPDVVEFLERCFDAPVMDGYGSTEAGVITFDRRVVAGDVTAWKLVDVPELGYRITDVPFPRGELCVKTVRLIPGYYRNPEATRGLFDAEGYLVTGDIVEQRGDELLWIDRRKNVLKLAQGEFVSISRLEEVFAAGSAFLKQVFLHGDSLRSYLLAVLVPDLDAVEAELGVAPGEPAIRHLLRRELSQVAAREDLRPWEVPRDFVIEMAPFTRENGLLTESAKPARPKLRSRYAPRLARLYDEIERAQLEELYEVEKTPPKTVPLATRVERAFAAVLGVQEVSLDQSFRAQGGDSLLAQRAAQIIEERFGVSLPVGAVLDTTAPLRKLIDRVLHREGTAEEEHAASFEEVHGKDAAVVRAADLRLDRFLSREELAAAEGLARAGVPLAPPRVVLLTGANGFLGRFLALDLLENTSTRGEKVVCVVRAPTDEAAWARLTASYQGRSDRRLEDRFRELAANGRLEVLAGDLMKPRLGLTRSTYERLSGEVDAILHDGALVNHALSYAQLFEPNVVGTIEIIRLALRERLKSIAYVSTVGVGAGLARAEPVREDESGGALWGERPVNSGYAVGYSTSKWAGEVLLEDLAERFGLPIAVLRCSMIMAHREYAEQVNATDLLTRLFTGIVSTGLAPRSFEQGGEAGQHFDGLPVDFVAHAVTSITRDPKAGYRTFHVVNPHWDDGVSLDVLVDWIAEAGYPIEREPDYARWLARWRERLEDQGPAEKQRGPLAIVHRWAQAPEGEGGGLRFDASRLEERLGEIARRRAEGAASIPHLTRELLRKMLDDMRRLGLIGSPGAAGQRRVA